jgi:hypothetical protein
MLDLSDYGTEICGYLKPCLLVLTMFLVPRDLGVWRLLLLMSPALCWLSFLVTLGLLAWLVFYSSPVRSL